MPQVAENLVAKRRSEFEYRCRICGFPCRKVLISGSDVPVVRIGNYGTKGTPTPDTFADELYAATTISFTAASGDDPAKIADSAYLFVDKLIQDAMVIRIATDSGTNDGDYTIASRGVSRGEILLSSSDSLTTEDAATAGEVTISKVMYKPNRTQGCPQCGSLNSR